MTASDKKFLKIMPKLESRRVEILLEDVLGCRWTISVLRAVSKGVRRPGALERNRAAACGVDDIAVTSFDGWAA